MRHKKETDINRLLMQIEFLWLMRGEWAPIQKKTSKVLLSHLVLKIFHVI